MTSLLAAAVHAKRRRGLGTMSPGRFGRQPNVSLIMKKAVSEQAAQRPTIETGLIRQNGICSVKQKR